MVPIEQRRKALFNPGRLADYWRVEEGDEAVSTGFDFASPFLKNNQFDACKPSNLIL